MTPSGLTVPRKCVPFGPRESATKLSRPRPWQGGLPVRGSPRATDIWEAGAHCYTANITLPGLALGLLSVVAVTITAAVQSRNTMLEPVRSALTVQNSCRYAQHRP